MAVLPVDKPQERADPRVVWFAYGYALIVALCLGHFLLGLPIQLSDSFGQMLKLSASWGDLLVGEFTQRGYMRPLMWGELKLVHDLSGGSYWAWFRGAHVVEVAVLSLLYVALVRPRTVRDVIVLPLGFAVLTGMHTFQGTVREAFPLNHFMAVLLYCFAAAVLVIGEYRRWKDAAGVILFAVAALTIESGLLVWVILVGGVLVGARGMSRGGVAVLVLLLAGYFVLRFPILGVGSPELIERSSGFGFRILDPPDLLARFGPNPYPFYLYNVVCSFLSVLLSEPTGGVFRLTHQLLEGDLDAASLVTPIASIGATALVFMFIWRRRAIWLQRRFQRDDQLVILFLFLLVANAVISYPYVKDVVMSPAGAFFAVAVFVAARHALAGLPAKAPAFAGAAAVAAFAVIGSAWAVRVVGMHVSLRSAAYVERNEWAYANISLQDDGVVVTDTEAVLLRTLRDDAMFVHPPPPPLAPPLRRLLQGE